MRIRNILFERFRGFEKLNISFPADANQIVFIGENGSGKSSLLEGISMILRDASGAHHRFGAPDWNDSLNVMHPHKGGTIRAELQGPKQGFTFFKNLYSTRPSILSEDRAALDKGGELTDEERMNILEKNALSAFEFHRYDIAIDNYKKLAKIQEQVFGLDSIQRAVTNKRISDMYLQMKDYVNGISYAEQSLNVLGKAQIPDYLFLAIVYYQISVAKLNLPDNTESALEYAAIASALLKNIEPEREQESLGLHYMLSVMYKKNNFNEEGLLHMEKCLAIAKKKTPRDSFFESFVERELAEFYEKNEDKDKADVIKEEWNNLFSGSYLNYNDYASFNEALDLWTPVILHYTARQYSVDFYKDALPMAFKIPMTTDFDMISDWFTEHENDENRKRLRVNADYRSVELETIRKVIIDGLTKLSGDNGIVFSDLRTEIDETVKDGQVGSWLSIQKGTERLHVNQLSDGEKRVLILLADIARRLITAAKINKSTDYLAGTGIVLIDEIEQHLHPKWQRALMPTLGYLFPNVQFIVTTHSPQVLSYVPNGCAFSLAGGAATSLETYGRDNQWILEAIMDDVNRPKEVQEKIDLYFDLIKDNKMNEAEIMRSELEKLIGADEPELLKADILIRRKLQNAR